MIYLDTGCLLKLYYPEPDSAAVARLVSGKVIAFSSLHELELTNALQLKAFRKEARATQVRATLTLVDADLRGGILHRVDVDWRAAQRAATAISAAHTAKLGCRSLDILHCAAAKALGSTAFLTTDARQKRLAVAIGLACPSVRRNAALSNVIT